MNCQNEVEKRVEFIRGLLASSGAKGIIFGNSGGKDSALVGILCKMACDNVLGVILPCHSSRNFGQDKTDAEALATQYGIASAVVDVTAVRTALTQAISPVQPLTDDALKNIAPRLRMTTLYAMGQSLGYLVAGTGNACEAYMGYFTKWGDGAHDFNPIADLTVREVYEILRYLNAPSAIIEKAPSAALFEGQTDEQEMGVTYDEVERVMKGLPVSEASAAIIERFHRAAAHKLNAIPHP